MSHDALNEQIGGGIDVAISANYRFRQTFGPGCARMYVLRPSVSGLTARLPRADRCQNLVEVSVANWGDYSVQITNYGGVALWTLVPGTAIDLLLVNNGAAAGEWFIAPSTGSAMSPALDANRQPFELPIRKGVSNNLNLRREITRVFGYDGVTPVSIRCTLEPGALVSSLYQGPAASFDTGVWPPGSSLMLIVQPGARIVGRGGDGGTGGNGGASLIFHGGDGGTALNVGVHTILINHGLIQGGGGGGGGGRGGAIGAKIPGGGGGGGAGHVPSLGGVPGLLTTGLYPGSGVGGQGTIDVAGAGGTAGGQPGGNGGGPGLAGSPGGSGGAGGAAGPAIVQASGVVLDKRLAGTIVGPQVIV